MVGYHRETHHFREEKSTKELTAPQHTRFILPLTSPDKIHRCAAWAIFFFYGHLSGRRPLHLANARPFGRLKAPLGLSLLRCASQTRACLWQAEQAHHANNEKQEVPTCWVFVKQFSRNDTATACQDWLRSTRLGRGSIKSHVRTVKVLGMGLFAFQERIHLWKGVTH